MIHYIVGPIMRVGFEGEGEHQIFQKSAIGWLFLALSLLGLVLALGGELEYEFSMATALISIAFFTSALYEGSFRLTKEPKLKTIKRN